MSVPHVLLGLLEPAPKHGYMLKSEYDDRFGADRPLRYGQVYATLTRLQREGWAQEIAIEPGAGPDRRRFAITAAGIEELGSWLDRPEPPTGFNASVLFAKTVLALHSGRAAHNVLDAQRTVHIARMRAVIRSARDAEPITKLAADYEIAHLQADIDWIETAIARLDAVKSSTAS